MEGSALRSTGLAPLELANGLRDGHAELLEGTNATAKRMGCCIEHHYVAPQLPCAQETTVEKSVSKAKKLQIRYRQQHEHLQPQVD